MNHFLHGVARATAGAFLLPGPILEVGAYQVAGQEGVADLRGLFPGRPYTGLDMRPGPGVDLVASVEELPLGDRSIGTALALSTFEHVRRFWKGFAELARVVRRDGALVVACPFYFHIHHHPSDYWRFTPEALDALMADHGFPRRVVGWHGPAKRPANVWAVGFGPDYPTVGQADLVRYRGLLAAYAREPVQAGRLARYHVARLLAGRGPFAPYLDQNRFMVELRGDGAAVAAA